MRVLRDLRRLLPAAGFRRLLGVRVLGQSADGVFQVVLTAHLFFSPERQTTPAAIAWASVATLVPFTLVGPFAGVLLDRWWRRDVLVGGPLARAVLATGVALAVLLAAPGGAADAALFVLAVAGFAVNRFLLAALSAALPHTVDQDDLLAANAVAPTTGTLAYTAGLVLGGLVQGLLGGSDGALAATLGLAVVLWALAAALAARFVRCSLGPDVGGQAPGGAAWRGVAAGLGDGVRHLVARPTAGLAIVLVGAHRALAGITVVAAVLLSRSAYAPDDPGAGLAGLGLTVAAAGAGIVLASLAVPTLVARTSVRTALAGLLAGGALTQAAFAATGSQPALVVAAFALALSGQALKIGADTLVQQIVSDDHRGRVFALYDVAFNTGLVAAAVLGAVLLPTSGQAPEVMAAVALGLLAVAAAAARVLPCTRATARTVPDGSA